MKIFHLLPVLTLGLALNATAPAQTPAESAPAPAPSAADAPKPIDPAKEAEIRKLLQLTGALKMGDQMMAQMITIFKTRNTGISDEFWTRFQSQMDTSGLIEKIIPLYDKYYSLEDLKAVNAFYSSPAGQRMLGAMPQLMKESMQVGQEWGRALGQKLVMEIQKEKTKQSGSAPAETAAKPTDK